MSVRRETSLQVRELIIKDRKKGESFGSIAKKHSVSKTCVEKICKKFEVYGKTENLSGRGRKKCTTSREDSLIVRKALSNPLITRREIKENLKLNISTKTISRRLREKNLHSRAQRKKPLLSEINKKKRLRFAKKYINKPLSFWKKVIWSDESKFELYGSKRRRNVWREPNKALEEKFLCPTVKHGGGSIMIWGCFSYKGVGNLVPIEEKMTKDIYIDIINENLEESYEKMGLGSNYIFQQDNDPKHTAKKTSKFFKDCSIRVLDWPPQSPDLNPIENLWGLMEQRVEKRLRKDKEVFLEELNKIWFGFHIKLLRKLVKSVPKRLKAVIRARESHTKY